MTTMEVKTICGNCGEIAVQPLEEKGMESREQGHGMGMDHLPDDANFVDKRKKAKKRRLRRLTNDQGAVIREVALADTDKGKKTLEDDDTAFLCGLDRKVLTGASCANCPGGCCNEKGLPTLIEVEGLAEEEIGGEVVDSGYSAKVDLFVVQLQRKDGRVVEAFYEGKSAELQGWTLLAEVKSGEEIQTITPDEARDIALKAIDGEAVSVDPDDFEGDDAWAVEINGADGKSYDVFVSLSGNVLGHDDYGLVGDFKSDDSSTEEKELHEEDEPSEEDEETEDEEVEEKSDSVETDEDFLRDYAELKSL